MNLRLKIKLYFVHSFALSFLNYQHYQDDGVNANENGSTYRFGHIWY